MLVASAWYVIFSAPQDNAISVNRYLMLDCFKHVRAAVFTFMHCARSPSFSQGPMHHSTLGSPPADWAGVDRLVVFVIDHSGSMSGVVAPIRSAIQAASQVLIGAGIAVHYIVFNDASGDSPLLENLPYGGGHTCISSAFVHLNRLIARNGLPKRLDIVFVSDGEDSIAMTCLPMFDPYPDNTRVFTVGVGQDFPFDVVFGVMLPRFGRGNDPFCTLVFPLDKGSDADWIFGEVAADILRTDPLSPPSLAVVSDKASSAEAIYREVVKAYNRCMHGYFVGVVSVGERMEERNAALNACSEFLLAASGVLRVHVREVKRSTEPKPKMGAGIVAPKCPHDVLRLVIAFNAKVKQLRSSLLIKDAMDQNTKRLVAGLAGR